MLQSIRDHTQGWIAGVIVTLLILSFALWGISSYVTGGGTGSAVAKVNGSEITQRQLSLAYERLRRQLQMQSNANPFSPEFAEAKLKERSLQTLIDIQVLQQASEAHNYRVSPQQIDTFIENMPEFQVNGKFSLTKLQKILDTALYSPNEFFELIKTNLLIEQPRLGVIFTSFSLPSEVDNAIELINQERNIQYMELPLTLSSKEPLIISKEEVKTYYDQHLNEFNVPEQMRINYIELSVNELMSVIQTNDDSLEKFFNDNKNAFSEPAQWELETLYVPIKNDKNTKDIVEAEQKAKEVFQKVVSGQTLSTLGKDYSLPAHEKLSGWKTINQIPEELQKSVLNLTKPKDITQPIKFENGYVLLQTKNIKPLTTPSFEKVKDNVKNMYVRQLAEEKFAELREKMGNIAYEHPDSLEPVAKALGLKIKTSELFSKEKGSDISSNAKIRDAAFNNEVINSNNSDVIQVAKDKAVVLRKNTHNQATTLPLEKVESQIKLTLEKKAIEKRSTEIATLITKRLQEGANPDEIAKEYHLTWKQTGFIGRHTNNISSAILESAFAMPAPKSKDRLTYTMARLPNGLAIIGLQELRQGVSNSEQYPVFAEQIQNNQGLMEYELYKQSLLKNAKIVIQN